MAVNTSEVCCSFDPQIKTSLLLTYLRNVNHTSRHQVAVSQHDTNEFNHSVALLCNPDGNSPCNVTSELETPAYLYVYVSTLFGAIFVAGVLGNLLVIQAVVRLRSMRTRMNYFLVSLSLADLLVLLICKPTAIIELFSKDVWLIGEAMCKYCRNVLKTLHNAGAHVRSCINVAGVHLRPCKCIAREHVRLCRSTAGVHLRPLERADTNEGTVLQTHWHKSFKTWGWMLRICHTTCSVRAKLTTNNLSRSKMGRALMVKSIQTYDLLF